MKSYIPLRSKPQSSKPHILLLTVFFRKNQMMRFLPVDAVFGEVSL